MTASPPNRRLQIVAVVFAGAALAMAAIAIIVVSTRSSGSAGSSGSSSETDTASKPDTAPKGPTVVESRVEAGEIVKLDDSTRGKLWSSAGDGIRIDDAALRKSFGLEADDVIVAIAGHEIHRGDRDLHRAMFDITMSLSTPNVVDVDVTRKAGPMLMRWRVSGDLRAAARDFRLASIPAYGGGGSGSSSNSIYGGLTGTTTTDPFATGGLGTYTPDPPDPLVATIKKIDDNHVEMPASTRDKLLADPMTFARGARVVPAMKNGQPDGFKLYAIRPSSMYAAMGFMNGDTLHSVNGYELNSRDTTDAYIKLKTAKSAVFDITRRGRDMTITIDVK